MRFVQQFAWFASSSVYLLTRLSIR
jgi:hypothetical protein